MADLGSTDELPTICMFWHGQLGWLETLSMKSFLAQGHRVEVYSYGEIEGLPDGVDLLDANQIISQDKMFFYKGIGTSAVFSDWFRLELLKHRDVIWADTDVYCLKPFRDLGEYVFAWENPFTVNNAVIAMPSDEPLLEVLTNVITTTKRDLWVPHLPKWRRIEVMLRRLVGDPVRPWHMQFGATGPWALTYYLKQMDMMHLARPRDIFYPILYEDIPQLLTDPTPIETKIGPETVAVHLWRSQFTRRGRSDMIVPETDSALDLLCRAHDVRY